MSGSCCGRPIATIIKVGDFEAGISRLEAALQSVYVTGVEDEEQIKSELLRWMGNSAITFQRAPKTNTKKRSCASIENMPG